MLNVQQRINALAKLGRFMAQHSQEDSSEDLKKLNKYFLEGYYSALQDAQLFNHWFSAENLKYAAQEWASALSQENLEAWVKRYPNDYFKPASPKTVAIIMAGNIPLVGFHDFLSVLLSGNKVLAKPSSDDEKLMPYLAQVLVAIEKDFAPYIQFADGQLKNFDAIIATGSDNSARYFDHYFGKYPHIIRKNRSSVAVLSGQESAAELEKLGDDIFTYFGLGCRNVSKVYLPKDYNINQLFEAFYKFKYVTDNNKYGNNYDYNRAIYLMEKHDFLDNGFFIIKEEERLHAPVAVLHTGKYEDLDALETSLQSQAEKIQCIASNHALNLPTVKLGQTQKPALWDYADNVDTLKFLRTL
jgi:hypothetical protein